MHLEFSSPDLAKLEKTLNRRFGRKAVRKFMKRTANQAIAECESATVQHLATKFHIPPSLVKEHIYFKKKSDGQYAAVTAWSPTRTVQIKQLNPIQTATGVSWRWAGRKRSRRHAFLMHGHVFRRKKEGGQLVARLPIEKVKGPVIAWGDSWNSQLHELITNRFFADSDRWMNEHVR